MKAESALEKVYDDYYEPNPSLSVKRTIAARQTVSHMLSMLPNRPYASLLDIGAGEGSVLADLSNRSFAKEYHAVELSRSGVAAIKQRGIAQLRSILQFDGYHIEAPKDAYEIATAIHVLEHVEHERAFIREVVRVCNVAYIEVPLELTGTVDAFIRVGRPYGHINFYNASLFRNLIVTAGAEILDFRIFPYTKEYELHMSGLLKGHIKHAIRSSLLKISPRAANYAMSYVGAALCRRASTI